MQADLQKQFRDRFQKDAERFFFCPGRVNLIGEHIDYNGGRVMPCAISQGTWLAIARNIDKRVRFHSMNFPESADLKLQSSYSKTGTEWFNFPLGVINQLINDGHNFSGMDLLFYGDLPVGAGLSSSASIEVLTAYALNELFQLSLLKEGIALLSKKVENEFIGLNCGIMDQFAVAIGAKNKAILLNCDTLEYIYLPFDTKNYQLTIINSMKSRTLVGSKYNERFAECGAALKLLKQELDEPGLEHVKHLCDIDLETFEIYRHLIDDPVLEKRALHVISENERVTQAVIALNAGRLSTFGQLMYASHQSLKELYEVSGSELDTIVEFCKHYKGCIGARMTGAGFGGCAIALVKKDTFEDFVIKLTKYYTDNIGYTPEIYPTEIGEGVREVNRQ